MLNLLILFSTIILLISSTAGLHAKMEKHVTDWLVITRCFFFILLTCQIIQLFINWKTRLLANSIWLIISLILFVNTANALREKSVTFGNPRHSKMVLVGMIINLCLALIIIFF